MIIVNGVVYANTHELALAIATVPELRHLRDEILQQVVQRPDSPVTVNVRLRRPFAQTERRN